MTETIDNEGMDSGKRPTFLTVLCILTFIGSGWGAISALAMQDAGVSNYAGYYYWVVLILNLGTLYGALQMWKMKKMGLYIWTACELIGVILMWVVIKGYLGSLMGGAELDMNSGNADLDSAFATGGTALIESAMNIALIIGSLFPVLFVILYWVNAKHLK